MALIAVNTLQRENHELEHVVWSQTRAPHTPDTRQYQSMRRKSMFRVVDRSPAMSCIRHAANHDRSHSESFSADLEEQGCANVTANDHATAPRCHGPLSRRAVSQKATEATEIWGIGSKASQSQNSQLPAATGEFEAL
jgi:hypothetical protein